MVLANARQYSSNQCCHLEQVTLMSLNVHTSDKIQNIPLGCLRNTFQIMGEEIDILIHLSISFWLNGEPHKI